MKTGLIVAMSSEYEALRRAGVTDVIKSGIGKAGAARAATEFILAEHPDYPKGKSKHGDFYAIFGVKHKYQPTIEDSVVTVRVKDFAKRTPKIAQATKSR